MKISDKIFVENKSSYTVIQARVAILEGNKTIGSTLYVNPGARGEFEF